MFYSATVPTLVGLSKEAAMVVVGYRGHGGVLVRNFLGSVSSGLVYHAHCPVAVIHDDEPLVANVARAPVLVGIDGSPASEAATAIAFEEASRRGVGLMALHAWTDLRVSDFKELFPNFDWDAQLADEEETLAERLAGWHERYPDVGIRRRIEIGDPATSADRGVRTGTTDCGRQPRPRRVRWHVAGIGRGGGGQQGQDPGDRGASVLTAAVVGWLNQQMSMRC